MDKPYRVTWTIDIEADSPLDAARKAADTYFSERVAEGHQDSACVFEVTPSLDANLRPVTDQVDLSQHRYKLEACHTDTCLPSFWAGHHLPHIQVPVYKGMSLATLKRELLSELKNGVVLGADAPPDHDAQWYRAAADSIHALELNDGANADDLFPDLDEEPEDGCESVYSFFVFVPQEED